MRILLQQNNQDLLRDVEQVRAALQEAELSLLPELKTFYDWLIARCEDLHQKIVQNLDDLAISNRLVPK
ncbi:MAG: hypothetical protein U1F76_18370 [Candidatus Competibacteraceae bacterium]